MIEKIALRIFWFYMIACALTFLSVIWIPFAEVPDGWMPLRIQIVMTFFVVGLASFLVWVPLMVNKFYRRLT